ncbi:MAG: hypothetical protein LZF86_220012 [Nitrospira sp.]|nr:MAG: hypothetical protein LZF86_220012 [Nitrospira sp.]
MHGAVCLGRVERIQWSETPVSRQTVQPVVSRLTGEQKDEGARDSTSLLTSQKEDAL